MIAVPHHQIANLLLAVRLQRRLAPDAIRRAVPLVEGLVPHDKAHPVAQIEQLRGRGIMARADGVDAHVPHDLQLPLHGTGVERRPERPLVVVQADAVKLHPPAVEMKAIIGRELECADAERDSIRIRRPLSPARTTTLAVYSLGLSMSHR